MSLDTWVSLAVLVTGLSGLYAALHREIRDSASGLKADMRELRTGVKADMSELRTELKADIATVRTDLGAAINRLDDRVYALAAGLRPLTQSGERAE